jgi:hypothetical protein
VVMQFAVTSMEFKMNKNTERPNMRVKITLSLAMQDKLLLLMSEHLSIRESFPQPHMIYMQESQFLRFMFAAQKAGHKVTFEQLKAEYVDMKKEPVITMVRSYGDTSNNYKILDPCVENTEGRV